MITTAVTAAITAVLTWAGIPPGPYIAGIWIAVKVVIVGLTALVAWRATRRATRRTSAEG